jgi:hypothetical protein
MMTSPQQTLLFTEEKSTSSQVVFLVNRTQPLENDLEKKMTATSGQRCLEQYERFSRPTLWGRMFSDLLIGMEGWYSTKCRLTWKLKGTKYNRLYFQLVPSTHPTEGIEFGLLPTVTTQETPHLQAQLTQSNRRKTLKGNSHSLNIADLAVRGMLPTPSAFDHKSGVKKETYEKRKQRHLEKGVNLQYPLKQMAADFTNQNGKVSQLNPPFVLEMMGFPPDWTELPFLNGETKA